MSARTTEPRFQLTTHKVNRMGYILLMSGDRIQTWALEEARRRLEAEGILADPDDEAEK